MNTSYFRSSRWHRHKTYVWATMLLPAILLKGEMLVMFLTVVSVVNAVDTSWSGFQAAIAGEIAEGDSDGRSE